MLTEILTKTKLQGLFSQSYLFCLYSRVFKNRMRKDRKQPQEAFWSQVKGGPGVLFSAAEALVL